MKLHKNSCGGENFSIRDIMKNGKQGFFSDRITLFSHFMSELSGNQHNFYMRQITSAADIRLQILRKEC